MTELTISSGGKRVEGIIRACNTSRYAPKWCPRIANFTQPTMGYTHSCSDRASQEVKLSELSRDVVTKPR